MVSDDPGSGPPEEAPQAPEPPAPRRRRWWLLGLDLLAAAGIVLLALYVAQDVIESKPRPKRAKPPRRASLVEVTTVTAGRHQVTLQASGEVAPSRQVDVLPEVGGRVLERNPALEIGSLVAEGDPIAVIDDADYQVALRRARAELVQAQADLKLERGSQKLAKREYELLGSDPEANAELVLRAPQLAAAKARAAAASASVAKAKLDLERTKVSAPFDAVVRSRGVEVGSQVGPSTPLVRLVGTDLWWVEVQLPTDELRWLQVGDVRGRGGSLARIYDPIAWGPEAFRVAHVASVAPDLDEGGRMARVLLAVEDPLARKSAAPTLKIGQYVRVELAGSELDDVVELPRELLRDGRFVWVMSAEDTLAIREVEIAFAGREVVLVSAGLAGGDKVVTTPLPAPVEGMGLRVAKPPSAGRTSEKARAPERAIP